MLGHFFTDDEEVVRLLASIVPIACIFMVRSREPASGSVLKLGLYIREGLCAQPTKLCLSFGQCSISGDEIYSSQHPTQVFDAAQSVMGGIFRFILAPLASNLFFATF